MKQFFVLIALASLAFFYGTQIRTLDSITGFGLLFTAAALFVIFSDKKATA